MVAIVLRNTNAVGQICTMSQDSIGEFNQIVWVPSTKIHTSKCMDTSDEINGWHKKSHLVSIFFH